MLLTVVKRRYAIKEGTAVSSNAGNFRKEVAEQNSDLQEHCRVPAL